MLETVLSISFSSGVKYWLLSKERHGKTAATGLFDLQYIAMVHRLVCDSVGLWIVLVVGILAVGIDGTVVFATFAEEIALVSNHTQ